MIPVSTILTESRRMLSCAKEVGTSVELLKLSNKLEPLTQKLEAAYKRDDYSEEYVVELKEECTTAALEFENILAEFDAITKERRDIRQYVKKIIAGLDLRIQKWESIGYKPRIFDVLAYRGVLKTAEEKIADLVFTLTEEETNMLALVEEQCEKIKV